MILASQLVSVTHYSPASTVLRHESSYSSFLYDLGCEMWVMQFEASKTSGLTVTRFLLTMMVEELGKAEQFEQPGLFWTEAQWQQEPVQSPSAQGPTATHGTPHALPGAAEFGWNLGVSRGSVSQQERAPDNKDQVASRRRVWEHRPASEGEGDRRQGTVWKPSLRGSEHFSFENAHLVKKSDQSSRVHKQSESFITKLNTWCGNWYVSPRPAIQAHSTEFWVKGRVRGKEKLCQLHMAVCFG